MLNQLKVKGSVIADDSIGYTITRANVYYHTPSRMHYRGWMKGLYTVGTESEFILAVHYRRRASAHGNTYADCAVRRSATLSRRNRVFLEDAGFGGWDVTSRVLIPPIWEATCRPHPTKKPLWLLSRKRGWRVCLDKIGKRKRFIR